MKSDMEDKEWLDDHMSLKQVNPKNPFTVPDAGYFDDLEQRITSYIHLNELNDDAKGFTVPGKYFDELSANIQSRIAIEELTNTNEHSFTVPEGYFNTLQENIQARILIDETVNETEHFIVPADYFSQLNKNILNKTVNQDIVKRKGVVRKMFASASFKYAAAACFALVVGTGIFVKEVTDPAAVHNSSFLHQQISTLPVSDIQSYLQQDVDANDTQHAVIDEGAPVNDAGLNNALQDINDTNQ